MSDSEYTSSSESEYEDTVEADALPAGPPAREPEPKLKPKPKIGTKKYLIDQARILGIKRYSKMKKSELETILNVKIPGVTDTTQHKASPIDSTNGATTSTTVKQEEATVASNGSPKDSINEAMVVPNGSPKEATNDTTSSKPETVKQEEAKVASKVHFEPKNESEKLDMKLNSMPMIDLKIAAKRANIKISRYNPEIRKSTPKTRVELMFDLKKFCTDNHVSVDKK